ncbi:hypothetical protein VTN31DRAFT_3174 [Thermomyces dupontii]|uniref:uncharacterized protein n=1 Tax=Talaromyces thermophilus TaxID=28565 RepID=UPI0037439501
MVKSLLRTQEAARDWARETMESSITRDILRDMRFWNKLEELAKLLAIIDEPLRMSESQNSSVMKVTKRWLDLHANLKEKAKSTCFEEDILGYLEGPSWRRASTEQPSPLGVLSTTRNPPFQP